MRNISIGGLVVLVAIVGLIALGVVALLVVSENAESAPLDQSCYVIMFAEVLEDDTWRSIANHWGMTVSTLRAMNKGVRLVEGAQVKIAVLAGCPR